MKLTTLGLWCAFIALYLVLYYELVMLVERELPWIVHR